MSSRTELGPQADFIAASQDISSAVHKSPAAAPEVPPLFPGQPFISGLFPAEGQLFDNVAEPLYAEIPLSFEGTEPIEKTEEPHDIHGVIEIDMI